MLERTAPRSARAVAAATPSGPVPRRRQDSSAEQLERLSSRLDSLIHDVRLGATSHRQHERHVDEAEAIAADLRNVFRAPSRKPLQQQGGKAWW